MKHIIMSMSPRCAARSRRLGVMIILDAQPVLVESGMLDLGSCAAPVVLELGGIGMQIKTSLTSSKA
jgi:hypothetical protein